MHKATRTTCKTTSCDTSCVLHNTLAFRLLTNPLKFGIALALEGARMARKSERRLEMLKKSKGFTLVELMIVVVIMGILAALAIPRFMYASARTKQSEAKGLLKQIYTMERSYYQENGTYTEDIDALGIEIMASSWYDYTIVSNGTNFVATATAPDPGIDEDPTPDIWTVNNTGVITCTSNDVWN